MNKKSYVARRGGRRADGIGPHPGRLRQKQDAPQAGKPQVSVVTLSTKAVS